MRSIKYFTAFLLLTFIVQPSFGQVAMDDHDLQFTIPEVAILDLEPNNNIITLEFELPIEAGDPLVVQSSGTNSTKWLNYSSAIEPGGVSRKITVQVTSGTVPLGVDLTVQATAATGGGGGTKGVPVGTVVLDVTAKTLITGIGRCYTGDGPSNGHQLSYTLSIADYSLLNYDANANLQITYTISD